MESTIEYVLSQTFGFEGFRRGQETVIRSVMEGRSALAVFPTGSGKSLCYQLPGALLPQLTLVVSPLLALMKDQVDFLKSKGIAAERLDSTLSFEQTREVYARARNGELKLLYVAPERVFNERFLAGMVGIEIDLLVIDEAHCISEWGHNFRPEYLKLAVAAKRLQAGRVLALTATATPEVVADICREFSIDSKDYVNTGFYRPNLTLRFRPTSAERRIEVLLDSLGARPAGPTVVYVTLQKTSETVAEALQVAGFDAKAYHAGMKSDAREETQNWFMRSDRAIVVATIAFGMGIDKSDIRYVYHYNLPKTLENYSQEIGRAGRDGQPSVCESLGDGEDLVVLENFIYGDTPSADSIARLLADVLGFDDVFDISVHELSYRFDIRPLVVRTLLTYLELDGILSFISPFYAEYQYRFLQDRQSVLQRFDENRRAFLQSVFDASSHKTKWSVVDLSSVAQELGEERARLVRAFQYLEETGSLEVKASNLRLSYRMLGRPNRAELTRKIVDRVFENESKNIQRTERMIQLFNTSSCKTRALLAYFGEELGRDCGHCDHCEGVETNLIGSEAGEPVEKVVKEALDLPVISQLETPLQKARFLCGISSPVMARSRLSRDPAFGRCGEIPFKQVLAQVEEGRNAST